MPGEGLANEGLVRSWSEAGEGVSPQPTAIKSDAARRWTRPQCQTDVAPLGGQTEGCHRACGLVTSSRKTWAADGPTGWAGTPQVLHSRSAWLAPTDPTAPAPSCWHQSGMHPRTPSCTSLPSPSLSSLFCLFPLLRPSTAPSLLPCRKSQVTPGAPPAPAPAAPPATPGPTTGSPWGGSQSAWTPKRGAAPAPARVGLSPTAPRAWPRGCACGAGRATLWRCAPGGGVCPAWLRVAGAGGDLMARLLPQQIAIGHIQLVLPGQQGHRDGSGRSGGFHLHAAGSASRHHHSPAEDDCTALHCTALHCITVQLTSASITCKPCNVFAILPPQLRRRHASFTLCLHSFIDFISRLASSALETEV